MPIFKSTGESLLLTLCSQVHSKKVYPIGTFFGKEKPKCPNEFLKQFVEDATDVSTNGFQNESIKISFSIFIFDTPAKAYVLFLKGHSGYDSCTKCKIKGKYVVPETKRKNAKKRGRVCFPGTGPFQLKTDEEFERKLYNEYDSDVEPILKNIPGFSFINSIPLDYMHLVLLGVMKRLITLWTMGPLKVRVQFKDLQKVSKKLLTLRHSIPLEFSRRPRSISDYVHYEATEFRTFLLYTGPIALKNILSDELYDHFLLLHLAITILVSYDHTKVDINIDYADELLHEFVKQFSSIYGEQFISQNVHSLLHLVNQIRKFGPLDCTSAFRFENHMTTIKKMIRKCENPLQQIARRYKEIEEAKDKAYQEKNKGTNTNWILKEYHCNGPSQHDVNSNIKQYKILKNSNFTINCNNSKDTCVILKDGTFVIVKNILEQADGTMLIVGEKLVPTENLYDNPPSNLFNIHIAKLTAQ